MDAPKKKVPESKRRSQTQQVTSGMSGPSLVRSSSLHLHSSTTTRERGCPLRPGQKLRQAPWLVRRGRWRRGCPNTHTLGHTLTHTAVNEEHPARGGPGSQFAAGSQLKVKTKQPESSFHLWKDAAGHAPARPDWRNGLSAMGWAGPERLEECVCRSFRPVCRSHRLWLHTSNPSCYFLNANTPTGDETHKFLALIRNPAEGYRGEMRSEHKRGRSGTTSSPFCAEV